MSAASNNAHDPQPRPTTDNASAGHEQRIAVTIDAWKRKLLDLSRRNRAINFKINKVSTIAIVDEEPAEIFRLLQQQRKTLKFKPQSETGTPVASGHKAATSVELAWPELVVESAEAWEETDDTSPARDFAPYVANALDARHTDDELQTNSIPEALDRSLRRLDEQARSVIDEQGVNALFLALGMLHYKEADSSTENMRAPLILLPVELSRRSARAGYTVKAADEDPQVNPALVEYLRRNFGIALPELPDASASDEDYDLQSFFTTASGTIAQQSDWAIKTEIYLGLFSFQKFVMYKDLETNSAALSAHNLVCQLITRTGQQHAGLPADVREMELDRDYAPESTFQVVDADSSQLRAVAAVARGYDLVLEGPPGTGKSQTITNLIAQALAAGKSVLFVAEKMAALQVVHSRLVSAGLGEFCLELHSTKASKRTVMRELKVALDASLQGLAAPTASTESLPRMRATLTAYAQAVHEPYGALQLSPFQGYGKLGAVLHAPKARLESDVSSVTRGQLDYTTRTLRELAAAAEAVGDPSLHAWRDTRHTFYSEQELDDIRVSAQEIAARLSELAVRAQALAAAYGMPPLRTFADIETTAHVASVLARSPGAPLAVLENAAWNDPPPEAAELLRRGRKIADLSYRALQKFTPAALEIDHADDIAYVERKSEGLFNFLAFLDGRYRAIKKRWAADRLPSYQASLIEQAHELKAVDELRRERHLLEARDAEARQLFGALWQGAESSWETLERYVAWVVEFRGLCVKHGLQQSALQTAAQAAPDTSTAQRLQADAVRQRGRLTTLCQSVGWPDNYFADATLAETEARVVTLAESIALGPRWASFEAARQKAAKSIAGELLPAAFNKQLAFSELAPAFLRAFYQKWLASVVGEREVLRDFHTLTHEQRVREFQELDERVLLENRAALVGRLRDATQHRLQQPEAAAAMPNLRREMARQRGLNPLRKTMKQAEAAIRAIKPCFMMSPQSVAQLLDGAQPSFDLVIFDEASQLPPEDAAGAIMRGKQLVVVGDPKQLPPTNFFSVTSGQVEAPTGDDGTPLYEDSESILEEFMGAGLPQSRLKWHYRSAHESLITFSNVSFYDAELYTFPSVETGTHASGLQFEYVADGVYQGKGLNLIEARRVADAVVRFAREQAERRARGEREMSLGVGTFNLRQQIAIQDELEQRRRQEPNIEPFFARKEEEGFFVKNLENIQGDERDVVFLSVTYARATDGRLRYNFGPLNGENGWRRLNVLTTRARHAMRVFSSIRGDDINLAATTARGAQLLREFLIYAEHGRLESVTASALAATESPFERDVLKELKLKHLSVVPQVGVAGYRIDLGVLDEVVSGRFICGIECDGAAYHLSETARDRDRLRQQVLEARGWDIHRVWSTDWFKDRAGQIERLLKLIEQSRAHARQKAEAEREARAAALADFATTETSEAEETPRSEIEVVAYVRPLAVLYRLDGHAGRYAGTRLLDAPQGMLAHAVQAVVDVESPMHLKDLIARVAEMWNQRSGPRISERIAEVCGALAREGRLTLRGDFVWHPSGKCQVRSRAGTNIPAERIAPEEIGAAVLSVLRAGRGFARSQLVNEARAVLGFNRTGPSIEAAVGAAIDALLQEGRAGEGSLGVSLRE
ncbi:MAG: DUF3320 domain-containing protein [Pyrinomonadaceae bacterium]